ncbi:DUF3015 domain-containing protein [Leptospira sp. 2 VSF19]|uniref:DUF3015 domain-containing protein n=1 Tax=Leptospira soteropolitanensis TaxID=2950025 RepID=A0AAW5VHI8_9LEPT|nr:DUF3015 domain-containing protein [Leptospira soteropolitanensis]MCW7491506.1 DUF3015 domain-containing protein [Leptospira soteropolitanensis]MCW7499090.1 DUF3015 domain-containing protein [Leptospira soteropolitanensis]MCW7521318.1 DUF3015 domain-containing protein [Leptospira soteropolitanensis]MCW7525194.1 DUF3015 domain-containing protein [Leptospira soteropolitanensis]MCW7529061.1 DUF3015 domain-containing protein [Leptospira soteropolitanensis]
MLRFGIPFFILQLTIVSLFLVSVTRTVSAEPYGMAGCGLGSMVSVWKNDIGQVLAATTNVSLSSQTFGITSGTSNCTTDGIVRADRAQEVFVTYNEEPLELETTRGTGERIRAIASLLGCPTHSYELGKLMKEKHSYIFEPTKDEESKVRSKIILSRLKAKIAENPELKQACIY